RLVPLMPVIDTPSRRSVNGLVRRGVFGGVSAFAAHGQGVLPAGLRPGRIAHDVLADRGLLRGPGRTGAGAALLPGRLTPSSLGRVCVLIGGFALSATVRHAHRIPPRTPAIPGCQTRPRAARAP